MSDENKIRDAADAVKGIVEAVPVYEDLVQPAARELGRNLGTVAKTVRIALSPITALVWGYDKIEEFVDNKLADKLKNVPPERLQTPPANIAGPALESLRYTGHQEELREMYANLLATSVDSATASAAHPSFVDIIRQLTPDEAKLLRFFATPAGNIRPIVNFTEADENGLKATTKMKLFSTLGVKAGLSLPARTPAYLSNLDRLGLIELTFMASYSSDEHYAAIFSDPVAVSLNAEIKSRGRFFHAEKGFADVTPLGAQFIDACIADGTHGAVYR